VLDAEGRPRFYDLLRRRGEPVFYAFDCLSLDACDLRMRPLIERKRILAKLVKSRPGIRSFGASARWDLAPRRLSGPPELSTLEAPQHSSTAPIPRAAETKRIREVDDSITPSQAGLRTVFYMRGAEINDVWLPESAPQQVSNRE
jgi:hypothetical protein